MAKDWSEAEEQHLMSLYHSGVIMKDIAEMLERTYKSVEKKIYAIKYPDKVRGQKRKWYEANKNGKARKYIKKAQRKAKEMKISYKQYKALSDMQRVTLQIKRGELGNILPKIKPELLGIDVDEHEWKAI